MRCGDGDRPSPLLRGKSVMIPSSKDVQRTGHSFVVCHQGLRYCQDPVLKDLNGDHQKRGEREAYKLGTQMTKCRQ